MVGRALFLLAAAVACTGSTGNRDSCLRYGGGSCCPQLNPIDRSIDQAVQSQPLYIVFLSKTEESRTVDNMCLTFFPVPDDSNTYLLYVSRVYNNGLSEIKSYIVSEPETGIRKFGNALCQYTDTVFARVECDCDVYLNHRCSVHGECASDDPSATPSGVYGFSDVRRPMSRACLNRVEAAIRNSCLPEDDFHILPMRLPSRCVLNQVCTVTSPSTLQRFCQTVGVAFPAVNRCANY